VTGLYDAAVAVLGLAGAAKVARPADTATALRGVGVPVTAALVRAAAGVEVAIAVVALVVAGPWPGAAVAASYVGFTAFVAVALARRLPLATCGCFGRADTPPSLTHVAVDGVAAVAAIVWALTGRSAAITATFPHPELLLGAIVTTGLAVAVLTNPLARA
jgi:hypothetical protein